MLETVDIERLAEEGIRAAGGEVRRQRGAHQDNRQVLGVVLLAQSPTQLDTVHEGHHHVADDEVGLLLRDNLQRDRAR